MEEISTDFSHLASEGFSTILIVLIGVALSTIAWGVIKFTFRKVRARRSKKRALNKKIPGKHHSNTWEDQWQRQQHEQIRGNRAITREEHELKQKELADRRDMYRMKRKENQWKK